MAPVFPLVEIEQILKTDPGDPSFIEYGEFLRIHGNFGEALIVLHRGLSSSPSAHRGRLCLARTYYELGVHERASEELDKIIKAVPASEVLTKLVQELRPTGSSSSPTSLNPKAPLKQSSSPEEKTSSVSSHLHSPQQLQTPLSPHEEVIGELDFSLDDIEFSE